MLSTLLLASLAAFGQASGAPAADLCKSIAPAEVAAVLGREATKGEALIPGSCSWNGKGANLLVTRVAVENPAQALMVADGRKAGAAKDEIVRDEPGLGQRASSTLAANKRTLTFIVADGANVWSFTLSKGDQAIDADAVLPPMRELARKAVAAR